MKYPNNTRIAWTYMKKKKSPVPPRPTTVKVAYDTVSGNVIYDTVSDKVVSARIEV